MQAPDLKGSHLSSPQSHELSLLPARERQLPLRDWNATQTQQSTEHTLSALILAQAALRPDAIAVVCEERSLSYAQLDQRTNQLAHYLLWLGIGSERLVGICMERTEEMLIAVLGVLKAGGAYVPLDPDYPAGRLAYMVKDAQLTLLLSQRNLRERLPVEVATVLQDEHWSVIACEPDDPLDEIFDSQQLAYVIYTSGSTGQPQGVQISQRAVINFLQSMACKPGLTEHDTLIALTSLSFDITSLEFYLPLMQGARLIIGDQGSVNGGGELAALIESSGATVVQATPSGWRLLIDTGWTGSKHLVMLCGGEALSRDLASALLTRGYALWNMYGSTETTIWSTIHQVSPADERILIGQPMANTQTYVLDSALQPVPIGVAGELYVGGEGLSRGYLHHPELTAEKFLPDPLGPEPGARLYRTGDLARYQPQGILECLGRLE